MDMYCRCAAWYMVFCYLETPPELLQESTMLLLQIMFLRFSLFFFFLSKCLFFLFGAQLFSALICCKTFSKVSKKVSAFSSL